MVESVRSENHWKPGDYTQRITTKQLRALLLAGEDTIIRAGWLCLLQKKNLGAGVYEIWFERPEGKASNE